MSGLRWRMAVSVLAVMVPLALVDCVSQQPPLAPVEPIAPPVVSAPPASIPPRDIVGRWGFASYHQPADRARTEVAARGQCNQPYVISMGTNGGVIMHLADQAEPVELRLKGGPDGKSYIGPDGPAADIKDREVVSFDGRVLILRWIDPEVAGRYGVSVYVRCGARA